jgi:hypothetical protein
MIFKKRPCRSLTLKVIGACFRHGLDHTPGVHIPVAKIIRSGIVDKEIGRRVTGWAKMKINISRMQIPAHWAAIDCHKIPLKQNPDISITKYKGIKYLPAA